MTLLYSHMTISHCSTMVAWSYCVIATNTDNSKMLQKFLFLQLVWKMIQKEKTTPRIFYKRLQQCSHIHLHLNSSQASSACFLRRLASSSNILLANALRFLLKPWRTCSVRMWYGPIPMLDGIVCSRIFCSAR